MSCIEVMITFNDMAENLILLPFVCVCICVCLCLRVYASFASIARHIQLDLRLRQNIKEEEDVKNRRNLTVGG